MGITNNLYNVALNLLDGCIITILVTVVYIIGIIRYVKKQTIIIKEIEQIEIKNMEHNENI